MNKNNYHIKSKSRLGFSLLELMVVVILVAGFIAIAIPTINSLTGVEVKGEITKISALVSEVYGVAALTGKTHRIIFNLDKNEYFVEEKEGDAGDISPELGYEQLLNEIRDKKKMSEKESAIDSYVPNFKKAIGRFSEAYKLPKKIIINGAWSEQSSEVSREGNVAVYFFAGGYTQSAFISLAVKDNLDSSIFIAISPLTGAVEIGYGEPNIEDLLSSEREK